jgi:hypothetical protein
VSKEAGAFAADWAEKNQIPGTTDVGRQNAARHLYWQAMLTVLHGSTEADCIGNIHEDAGSDPIDGFIDRYNNKIGQSIGLDFLKSHGYPETGIPWGGTPSEAEKKALRYQIWRSLEHGLPKPILSPSDPRVPPTSSLNPDGTTKNG